MQFRSACMLLVSFLLLGIHPCKAQDQQDVHHFYSGLKLGINASQINGDDMAGFHHFGLTGGLFVGYNLTEKSSLSIEMLYSGKGSRTDSTNGPWHSLSLHYIEIPILFNYMAHPKVQVQIGPSIGYLFASRYEDHSGSIINSPTVNFEKKIDIGGTVGISYRFTDNFSVYARYTNSLIPFNKNSNLTAFAYYGSGLTNMVASFGLLYHFGTGAAGNTGGK